MATVPQLLEQDMVRLEAELLELLAQTDATTALIIDQGGFLIACRGDTRQFDLTSIAALAAGAFLANETIARLVRETHFHSLYQEGEQFSLFVLAIECHCLLVVIFEAQVSVGLVKYYALPAAQRVARQLQLAHSRNPNSGLDLSELNLADTSALFHRKPD